MHIQDFNYNGTIIQRRADGFINLTQMCQADGKRMKDFLDKPRTLKTLFTLYSLQSGVIRHPLDTVEGETWCHFEIACEFAYQASADFGAWFNLTFYDFEKAFEFFQNLDLSDYAKWENTHFPWRKDKSNDKEKQGIVYFILNETKNLLKIGFTGSNCSDSRMASFRSGAVGESLKLLGEIKGTVKDESYYHTLFSDYKYKGEWFRYEPLVEERLAEILAEV